MYRFGDKFDIILLELLDERRKFLSKNPKFLEIFRKIIF